MAVIPDFRITPNAKPWACRICTAPTTSWSVETFISDVPIETICCDCALKIAKLVISSPAAQDMIPLDERYHLAQALKASHTQTLVKRAAKQAADDDATAKKLLA